MKDGIPLYRDAHHLSVAGAMALEAPLSEGLITAPAERREVGPAVVDLSQINPMSLLSSFTPLSK